MSETTKNDSDDIENQSKVFQFFAFIRTLKIEVVMFKLMFSDMMRLVSITTLLMDKVCLAHLNFSEDVCRDLASHPEQKIEVEKLSNNYIVVHNLIKIVPALLVAVFIGTWSDKYGRKVPLVICMAGLTLEGLSLAICAAFYKSSAWFVVISAIFTGVSGSYESGQTIIYSYIADISTTRQRTFKYALTELVFGLSTPLGQLAGGWIYKFAGYVSVFSIAACVSFLTMAFIVFVLKETRGLDNVDRWSVKLKSFFSCKSVIEGMKATVKSRPNKGRTIMFLLILGETMTILAFSATMNIHFVYAHHQFDWDNTQYSTVSSTFSIVGVFLMFFAVPVFRHFNLGDAAIGITGNVSLMAKDITIGLAYIPGIYYLAQAFGFFRRLGTLASRSCIAKVASKEDIGKVFSFLSIGESLMRIIGSSVLPLLFNATLDIYPGLVYFIAGGLLIIPISVFIWYGRQPSDECGNLAPNLRKYGATENQTVTPKTEEKHH